MAVVSLVYGAVSKAFQRPGLMFEREDVWVGWEAGMGGEPSSHQAQQEEERVGLQRGRKLIVSQTRWKMPPKEDS